MFEQIVDIIAGRLTNKEEDKIKLAGEITPETRIIEDLNADSLYIAEILIAIDETLGINIPDEAVVGLKTVKDIVDYVETHQE